MNEIKFYNNGVVRVLAVTCTYRIISLKTFLPILGLSERNTLFLY